MKESLKPGMEYEHTLLDESKKKGLNTVDPADAANRRADTSVRVQYYVS